MRYQILLALCLSWCFLNGGKANASSLTQRDPCSHESLTSATAFYCQFGIRDSALNRFPTYRYLGAVEVYLQTTTTPYIISLTPQYFLDRLAERNSKFLIRNGCITSLKESFHNYQRQLNKLKQLTAALGVSIEAKKKDLTQHKGAGICDWSLIRQMRRTLWKSFRRFKSELSAAYETEVILLAQFIHNPSLFEAVNSLVNLDGSNLPIYVHTRPAFFGSQAILQHLSGMVVMSQQGGLFSSDTPAIRQGHPHFVGHKDALTVIVQVRAPGAILSHEYGHLYYLYHHWEAYTEYMEQMGPRYQVGGHGSGDASGIAAELAEKGEMPDFHMPWSFRKRKAERGQPLITLADE
ncbi:MAG: hypothetical protein HRU41_30245 [Saprospiraceae bacterium]|nr:hypothetical protein [Saprospiraceae bacterium]